MSDSPGLGPNCLTLRVCLKELFETVNFEKSADDNKSMENYPECKDLKIYNVKISSHRIAIYKKGIKDKSWS